VHPGRSGRNHLRWLAASNHLPLSRVDEVLALVGMETVGNKRCRGYSLGMRQRLGLAGVLLGDPHTVILDEPANGLDPEGIRWIRDVLSHLAGQGRTVLVSSHLLSEMALIAKDLVVFLHRPAGQAQFSRALAAQDRQSTRSIKSRLESLHCWIVEHLDEDLGVEHLAVRMKMTPRTFARKFVDWYGRTPAKLVEDLRLEAACRYLEDVHIPIKQIIDLCGFGDEERMRRTFMRRLRVSPTSYREQFAIQSAAAVRAP